MTIRNASKQASFFECIRSLRTGRHLPRFLQGVHRDCALAAAVRGGFLLHDVGPYVIANIAYPDKKALRERSWVSTQGEKVGSFSLGAMPMVHLCNLATW